MLRIVMAFFVYQYYFEPFTNFNLKDFEFYISAAYILFTLFLFVGGMIQKETLSVISGLALFVLPVVQVVHEFPDDIFKIALVYLIPLSIGFTFFSNGNNQ